MEVVEMKEVTKKFGDLYAVDSVSLAVHAGEVFGLLGPNGAGKSTAINMIIGLLKATSGSILVQEHDIARDPMGAKRRIGIVPQELAIYEDLTSIDNVKFFASLYGLRGRDLDAAAKEALEFTGLAEKASSAPKGFSGGMKRRLNIACAIAHRPDLLIMDEPTVGIDPQSRNHILQSVRTLNERGCTIIYTSHYMEEVEAICSRIAIMDHGKVIAIGTNDELKALITDTNAVWVTVTDPGAVARVKELESVPHVAHAELDGRIVKLTVDRDADNLDRIMAFFASNGISIRSVENKSPDLETVFLSLTGRNLRD